MCVSVCVCDMFTFQALHKADVLDREYEKIRQAVEVAKNNKDISPKQITRQIVQLTEVRYRHYVICIVMALSCCIT